MRRDQEVVPQPLLDLLWRDHPDAPQGGRRGPRTRVSTGDVVAAAVAIADRDGLEAVTVRRLATDVGLATMSVYTHVNTRDDLLVLMADQVNGEAERPAYGRTGWRRRVRAVAEANRALLRRHPWLRGVSDERVALGPGTIAKYDHELAALTPLQLPPVACDAALTFVLDFVRAAAAAYEPSPHAGEVAAHWPAWSRRLAAYLGDDYPLAQHVGAAAGQAMEGPRNADAAWEFGLERVLDGLAGLTRPR